MPLSTVEAIAAAVHRGLQPILQALEDRAFQRAVAHIGAVESRLSTTFLDRAGVPGPSGPPGPPGTLGTVATWAAADSWPAGQVVSYAGGLWQAQMATQDEPGASPAWLCLVRGLQSAAVTAAGHLELYASDGVVLKAGNVEGPAGAGFAWRGKFDPTATYIAGDLVARDGSAWLCTGAAVVGKCPGPGWELFAQRGRRGSRGAEAPKK
jgi:hypothetical protein